jgi:hypothetical protein
MSGLVPTCTCWSILTKKQCPQWYWDLPVGLLLLLRNVRTGSYPCACWFIRTIKQCPHWYRYHSFLLLVYSYCKEMSSLVPELIWLLVKVACQGGLAAFLLTVGRCQHHHDFSFSPIYKGEVKIMKLSNQCCGFYRIFKTNFVHFVSNFWNFRVVSTNSFKALY